MSKLKSKLILILLIFTAIVNLFPQITLAADPANCTVKTDPDPVVIDENGHLDPFKIKIYVKTNGIYDVYLQRGSFGLDVLFDNLQPDPNGWLEFTPKPDGRGIYKQGAHTIYVYRRGAPDIPYCTPSYQIKQLEELGQIACNILGATEFNDTTPIEFSGTVFPTGKYSIYLPEVKDNTRKYSKAFSPDSDGNIGTQSLGILNPGVYQVRLQKEIQTTTSEPGAEIPTIHTISAWQDVTSCTFIPLIIFSSAKKPNPDTTLIARAYGIPTGPGFTGHIKCDKDNKDNSNCSSSASVFADGCTNNLEDPGISTAIGCIHTSPVSFIKDVLKFVVGIAGGLAFLLMLLGTFQMLTSAGNPETLNAGRQRLTDAVIGLLFVIFSILLLQIIGVDILKLPGFGR